MVPSVGLPPSPTDSGEIGIINTRPKYQPQTRKPLRNQLGKEGRENRQKEMYWAGRVGQGEGESLASRYVHVPIHIIRYAILQIVKIR